jgi:hypothetical protein
LNGTTTVPFVAFLIVALNLWRSNLKIDRPGG